MDNQADQGMVRLRDHKQQNVKNMTTKELNKTTKKSSFYKASQYVPSD